MDLTNSNLTKKIINQINPNLILNCAAYTNVDKAEYEIETVNEINYYSLKNLAIISNDIDATLVHFSTDYVFDGNKTSKYSEIDKVNPLSIYANSKLNGENEIINFCNNFLILRVSWLFSQHKENFFKFVYNKLYSNNDILCVNDQFGIPTSADEVSKFIFFLINNEKYNKINRLYNFVNDGEAISWFQFAESIYKNYKNYSKTSSKIIPISGNIFFKNNIRPKYSALNNNKIKDKFNYKIDTWQNSIKQIISNLIK